MRAKLVHRNTHVYDLDATLAFYEKALGLKERRRKGPEDGFELELTWNRGYEGTYDNGNGDTHVCVRVDDYDAFHALHEEMGCIVKENPRMGLYFIADPDGCWVEIIRGLDEIPLEAARTK